jgi:hypothetical protein
MSFGELIRDKNFRNIVLSMMATYGLWLYASIIFFEPWHMFTSFIQYILLSPTWINIINVYAFCNVHDVSWGTKGQTSVSHDLGVVKASGPEKDKVDVDVPSDEKDIDAAYEVSTTASKNMQQTYTKRMNRMPGTSWHRRRLRKSRRPLIPLRRQKTLTPTSGRTWCWPGL